MAAPVDNAVATSAPNSNQTSISADYTADSGMSDDDLLKVIVAFRDTGALTLPSGWTEDETSVGGDLRISLCTKVAVASTDKTTHTFSWTTGSHAVLIARRVTGSTTTGAVDASDEHSTTGGTTRWPSAGTRTNPAAGSMSESDNLLGMAIAYQGDQPTSIQGYDDNGDDGVIGLGDDVGVAPAVNIASTGSAAGARVRLVYWSRGRTGDTGHHEQYADWTNSRRSSGLLWAIKEDAGGGGGGRIMSSLAAGGGLAASGGIAGIGGGLAG